MYGMGMAKGLMVTLKNMTKRPFTVQYPEERLKQHPRFRGEEFAWYEERCTGCASCAKYCPLGIIKIITDPSETAVANGDKYRLEVFDIELARCMFCGLCVEACPYDALFMGSGFEQGRYSRKEMVIGIDQLRQAEKHPSWSPQVTTLIRQDRSTGRKWAASPGAGTKRKRLVCASFPDQMREALNQPNMMKPTQMQATPPQSKPRR